MPYAFGFTVGLVTTGLSLLVLRAVLARRMPNALRIVLGALSAIPSAPLALVAALGIGWWLFDRSRRRQERRTQP